jgi:cellulose synthase/poly-beta-1,6-N-acetylglucosamine synthase-like glycosyltransferase
VTSFFEPQVPFESAGATSSEPGRAASGRRAWRTPAEQDEELAIEIAFLADYGAPRDMLVAASKAADGLVTAEQALFREGAMREEAFYRLLADHLRAPYYRGEIALAPCANPARAVRRGIAPLAPNVRGLSTVLAPRGASLALLLGALSTRGAPLTCAITSPQRLSAIMRFQLGRQLAADAAVALERADASLSAHSGLNRGQWVCGSLLLFGALLAAALWPQAIGAISAIALWIIFAAAIALRIAATAAAVGQPKLHLQHLEDFELPTYSIVAPLKCEANIVARLIEALDALDYPKRKLDIKIVVERDDVETLTTLAAMRLPSRYDIIVAPPGAPGTKPRALNVTLPLVYGEYVVVYDAEDRPAPDQLRLAAAHFSRNRSIDCLQARLVVDNIDETWVTRLFAIEYCALFDIVNPGLAAMRAPIALGGSSNHFRTSTLRRVGGWDAWNVTEDADLGLRMARFNCQVDALESDTTEEAPLRLRPWFGQRRRWLKGWFQTLVVLTRNPRRLVAELGWPRALASQALILGAVSGGLFGPAFFAYALWRGATGRLFAAPTSVEAVCNAITLLLISSGSFAVLAPVALALRRRGLQRLYYTLPLLPLYYCLVSIAAWAALVDLARRPYHWAKTEHGLTDPSRRFTPSHPRLT